MQSAEISIICIRHMVMCPVSRKRKQIIKMKSVFEAKINFKGHEMKRMRRSYLYKSGAEQVRALGITV